MKFGGQTCADEGIRLAMEQLMANTGFSDPDVVKYMVLFTDGKWNEMRTLLAAPGYTNTVLGPPAVSSTVKWLTNTSTWNSANLAAGHEPDAGAYFCAGTRHHERDRGWLLL